MFLEAIILLGNSYFGNALATVKQFYAQNGLARGFLAGNLVRGMVAVGLSDAYTLKYLLLAGCIL
jgi:hypothetical protein